MASYAAEREHFLHAFGREFPTSNLTVARTLLREATGLQRANETMCSIDIGEQATERMERREQRRDERVASYARGLGTKLLTNGDPRGFPYLLECPSGRTYDFGGQGLGIPGRGLPASAFGGGR